VLQLVGMKRSTFYYQQQALQNGDKYAELKSAIQATYDQHKGRYGYRRITAAVSQAGHAVSHNTVQRLMVQSGLKSLVRIKKYKSFKGEFNAAAPPGVRIVVASPDELKLYRGRAREIV
jgi:transposase InsO family protein